MTKSGGYSRLNEITKNDLINWITKQATQNIDVNKLVSSAEEHLFNNKVIIPSKGELYRLVRSVAVEVAEQWFADINVLIDSKYNSNWIKKRAKKSKVPCNHSMAPSLKKNSKGSRKL